MEHKLCVRLMLPRSIFGISFDGLHQLYCPTCSLKEKPQKGWTNNLPFSESCTKPSSSTSPFFTPTQMFTFIYTLYPFSHCCISQGRSSLEILFYFLLWKTQNYFGDETLCISIKRIKGKKTRVVFVPGNKILATENVINQFKTKHHEGTIEVFMKLGQI